MKIAFIKNASNKRMAFLDKTQPYSWLLENKKSLLLNTSLKTDVVFLGILIGLKCDFVILNDPAVNLADYDMLITLDPILKSKFRENQILCYIECEPFNWNSGGTGIFSTTQSINFLKGRGLELGNIHHPTVVEPYDFLLNNYIIGSVLHHNIPLWCTFMIDEMLPLRKEKIPNKCYISTRTLYFGRGRLHPGFSYLTDYDKESGDTYGSFYSNLSTCTFNLSLDETISAGQLTAECAIMDVITLGKRQKTFNKLLLPEYCFIDDMEEGYKKMAEILSNPELKDELVQSTRMNLPKIDYLSTEKLLSSQLMRRGISL